MDGSNSRQANQVDVEAEIRRIKQSMPQTYRAIQAKAEEIGRQAYAMVRRGIGGEPNTFYAIEAGFVVGTPFAVGEISAEVARWMVAFSTSSVIIWSETARVEVPHVA